jgi:pSer/pThr/pTyr-binding forkhead associated (FHA) protein
MLDASMCVAVLEICPARGRKRCLCGGVLIGRAEACDITLDDPRVSRRHARVLSAAVGTAIEDLDSANGVYVNGERRAGITPLHPGDVIQIGATVWLVQRPQPLGTIESEPIA